MWESVQESAHTLQSWVYDWRINTPSGQQKWIHGIGRPEHLDNGDTVWDTIIFDYSERQLAAQALAQTTAIIDDTSIVIAPWQLDAQRQREAALEELRELARDLRIDV